MEVLLDGRLMVSREAFHDLLKEKLNLPDYYGRNLDALYDMLSESSCDLDITIVHADVMLENLGKYGFAVMKTFTDASCAFPKVDFSVSNEIF